MQVDIDKQKKGSGATRLTFTFQGSDPGSVVSRVFRQHQLSLNPTGLVVKAMSRDKLLLTANAKSLDDLTGALNREEDRVRTPETATHLLVEMDVWESVTLPISVNLS